MEPRQTVSGRWVQVSHNPSRGAADPGAAPRRIHFLIAALSYTFLAIYGSLVPLRYTPLQFDEAVRRFRAIPYFSLSIHSRSDWVANLLLFLPLSFLWLGTLLANRRGRLRAAAAALFVLAASCVLSVAIEFTQLWFPPRTVSQNDLYAESIGAALGVGAWLVLGQRFVTWSRRYLSGSAERQFAWLLEAYVLGLVVYSLLPFDVTIRPAEVWEKFKSGKVILTPFSVGSLRSLLFDWGVDIITFAPAGMLFAAWRTAPGEQTRSLWTCLAIGLVFTTAIEAAQLFIFSRYTDVTDIVTETTGIVLGAAGMERWYRGADAGHPVAAKATVDWRWAAAAFVHVGLLFAVFWSPFDWIHDGAKVRGRLHGFLHRAPFVALQSGSDFNTMNEITRKTLCFAVLGAMVAAAVRRLKPRWLWHALGFVFCVGIGTTIELGQVLLPSHVADVTDVILYGTGAMLGMLVVARLAKRERC